MISKLFFRFKCSGGSHPARSITVNTSLLLAALSSALVFSAEPSIEELTVTAERRAAVYEQIMATRDFYDGRELVDLDVDHIAELLNQGAGVNFHRGNGAEMLAAIRSPVLTAGAGAGSFLYLEDGIPLRASGFANVNGLTEAFFETAASIELVKGPGSALYGSNAVHGLVNVASPSPVSGREFFRLSGGSHGFTQLQAGKNFSAKDTGYRADAFVARDDGWRSDSGYDQQKIKLQRLSSSNGISQRSVLDAFNLEQNTAGFAQGEDAYRIAELAEANSEPDAFRRWHSFRFLHRMEKAGDSDGSWVVTPYVRHNEMKFRLHFLPGEALEENSHNSIGFQSARYFSSGRQDFIYGLDAELTDGELRVFQENPDAGFGAVYPQGLHYDYAVLSRSISGFVQDRVTFGKLSTLELGVRAEYVAYDYDNKADAMIVGRIQRVADRKDDFFYLTPKISFSQESTAGVITFKLSRGARAPQTTDLYRLQVNQEAGDAEVETIDAFEIQHLYEGSNYVSQFNLYIMQKDNFFFRDADGFNVSDGKTRHRGVEYKLNYQLTDSFNVQLGASYAKHQYDFNRVVGRDSEVITKGDDVDSAPRKLANVRFNYKYGRMNHGLEWRYGGPYFMDAANDNRYPGHQVLVYRGDAQLRENSKLFWRVNNLTNARYAKRADFAFGNERYFPGERIAAFFGFELSL